MLNHAFSVAINNELSLNVDQLNTIGFHSSGDFFYG